MAQKLGQLQPFDAPARARCSAPRGPSGEGRARATAARAGGALTARARRARQGHKTKESEWEQARKRAYIKARLRRGPSVILPPFLSFV